MDTRPQRKITHRDLLPQGMCPSLMMKQIATHALDAAVHDERTWPGDGYYWCLRSCRDVGPDDELVRPESCVPGRACYDGAQS